MSEHKSTCLNQSALNDDVPSQVRSLTGDDNNSDVDKCDALLIIGAIKSFLLVTDYIGDPTKDFGTISP